MSYGKFNPSSPNFSYLLPVSVCVSMLSAGSTVYGLERWLRNVPVADGVMPSVMSRYGAVALLLRAAQTAALVFWSALLSCARKGWAAPAMLSAVAWFYLAAVEAATRKQDASRDENNHFAFMLPRLGFRDKRFTGCLRIAWACSMGGEAPPTGNSPTRRERSSELFPRWTKESGHSRHKIGKPGEPW